MNRLIKRITFVLFVIGIIITAVIMNTAPADEYTVTYIDVGQGDSAVVSRNNTNILIDAGTDKNARKVKIALDRLKIKTLDLVVLSHLDSDHISGMSELIKSYKVKKVITGKIGKKVPARESEPRRVESRARFKQNPVQYGKGGG